MTGICEVCDNDEGKVETYLGDVTAHPDCAPSHWVSNREKSDEFMALAMAKRTKEKKR